MKDRCPHCVNGFVLNDRDEAEPCPACRPNYDPYRVEKRREERLRKAHEEAVRKATSRGRSEVPDIYKVNT